MPRHRKLNNNQYFFCYLTVAEKTFGPDHLRVETFLNNLAFIYRTQGKFAEAELLYKRVLTIVEKDRGPNYPDVATLYELMAERYRHIGKEDEAETFEARARRIRSKR